MKDLITYEFLSWTQFTIIDFVIILLFLILSRFHLFKKHATEKSIGFRMIMYLLAIIVVSSFILIRPFFHFLLILVVFGMFFKNIISYSRALFSLYYSKVKFGDKISIGDVTGTLESMNFGGLHLLTTDNKVYFPFTLWAENKIIMESESGTVLVSFECIDLHDRSEYNALNDLKKSLFSYPFLALTQILIEKESDTFMVAVRISNTKYKGGLLDLIDKAGFRLKRNKL